MKNRGAEAVSAMVKLRAPRKDVLKAYDRALTANLIEKAGKKR